MSVRDTKSNDMTWTRLCWAHNERAAFEVRVADVKTYTTRLTPGIAVAVADSIVL